MMNALLNYRLMIFMLNFLSEATDEYTISPIVSINAGWIS